MSRIEEMIAVEAAVPRVIQQLLTIDRVREWISPNVAVLPRTTAPTLAAGARFRLEILGVVGFEYIVEAITDREVVFSFEGTWNGQERWSFVADGAETIIRRAYDVDEESMGASLAWATVGRPLVLAHYKFELSRFRDAVERDRGPKAEIRAPTSPPSLDFPVDEG